MKIIAVKALIVELKSKPRKITKDEAFGLAEYVRFLEGVVKFGVGEKDRLYEKLKEVRK
jgi:hypothetical protein